MNQPYPLYYTSADGPEPDATWSVYREVYANVNDAEPVEALTLHIGSYATEALAQAEAERLQADEQVSETRIDVSTETPVKFNNKLEALPMTSPQLGICDVHHGIHTFVSDGTYDDDKAATCCIGWMDYEPFVKPGDRAKAVPVLDDDGLLATPWQDVPDHEPMLPAPGIDNVPADQCGECGEVHDPSLGSDHEDVEMTEYTTFEVTATVTLNFDSRDGLVMTEDQARDEMLDYLAGANGGDFDITVTIEDTDSEPNFPYPFGQYKATHASNEDFSQVMKVKDEPFTIANENGDWWVADPEEWHEIEGQNS